VKNTATRWAFFSSLTPNVLVAVCNESEMQADVGAVGVMEAFHDSVSDEVHVLDALLLDFPLGSIPGRSRIDPTGLSGEQAS
jgi:hypothetical protein